VPNWLVAGVIVRVRFAPAPPKTNAVAGSRPGFEEVAARARLSLEAWHSSLLAQLGTSRSLRLPELLR